MNTHLSCLSQKIKNVSKTIKTVPTSVRYKLKKMWEPSSSIKSMENEQPLEVDTMEGTFGENRSSKAALKDNCKTSSTCSESKNNEIENSQNFLNLDKLSRNIFSQLLTELHQAYKIGDEREVRRKILKIQAFLQRLKKGEKDIPEGMMGIERKITDARNHLLNSIELSLSNLHYSEEALWREKAGIVGDYSANVEMELCGKIKNSNYYSEVDLKVLRCIGKIEFSELEMSLLKIAEIETRAKDCNKTDSTIEKFNIDKLLNHFTTEKIETDLTSSMEPKLKDEDLSLSNKDLDMKSRDNDSCTTVDYQNNAKVLDKTGHLEAECKGVDHFSDDLDSCLVKADIENIECEAICYEESMKKGNECCIEQSETVGNYQETVKNLEETCDLGSSCDNADVTVKNLEETCDLGSSCDNLEVTENVEETCDLGSSCVTPEVTVENLEETCDLGSSCVTPEVTVENLEETCDPGSSCDNAEVTVENLEETCDLGSSCDKPEASHALDLEFNLHPTCDPDGLCDLGNSHDLESCTKIGLLRCLVEVDQKLCDLKMKFYPEMENWDGKLFSITWKFSSKLTSDFYWLDPCVDCNGNEGNNGGAKKKNNGQQGEENGVRLGTGGNNIPSGPNQNHPTGDGEDPNEPNRKPKTDRIGGCENSQENQGARPKEVKTTPFENGETTVNPPNLTSLTSTIPRKRLARPSSLHQLTIPTAELSPPDDVRNPISPTGDSRLDSSNQGFEILDREHSGNIAETSGTQKLGDVQNQVVDFALPLGVPNNPKHFPANPEPFPLGGATGETQNGVGPLPIVTMQNRINARQNIEKRARDREPEIPQYTIQKDAVKNGEIVNNLPWDRGGLLSRTPDLGHRPDRINTLNGCVGGTRRSSAPGSIHPIVRPQAKVVDTHPREALEAHLFRDPGQSLDLGRLSIVQNRVTDTRNNAAGSSLIEGARSQEQIVIPEVSIQGSVNISYQPEDNEENNSVASAQQAQFHRYVQGTQSERSFSSPERVLPESELPLLRQEGGVTQVEVASVREARPHLGVQGTQSERSISPLEHVRRESELPLRRQEGGVTLVEAHGQVQTAREERYQIMTSITPYSEPYYEGDFHPQNSRVEESDFVPRRQDSARVFSLRGIRNEIDAVYPGYREHRHFQHNPGESGRRRRRCQGCQGCCGVFIANRCIVCPHCELNFCSLECSNGHTCREPRERKAF